VIICSLYYNSFSPDLQLVCESSMTSRLSPFRYIPISISSVSLAFAQLRRQGKAHQAGLHEGDTVLGLNGFSSRTMDHSAAMGLLESAIHSVELVVFR